MDIFVILLRIIHIFAGMFWVGAALIGTFFLVPAAKSSGPEGQKFIQNLMERFRFRAAISVAAILTILAGFLLYVRDSGGLQLSWITSSVGLGFTIGALAALASLFYGAIVMGPTGKKFGELAAAIQSQGNPPTPEQGSEMAKLNARMSSASLVNMVLLVIALLAMATARYWSF
ncbi:MAG TPA: hypothetical protein VGA03_03855 [Anaerolineales bacterium]